MKTLIRNFLSTLRRFKMATALNVLGLSVAFAAFIVIMIQVSYDLRFDSSIPDADNVYRINLELNGSRVAATPPRPVGEGFVAYSPHVKAVAITNAMFASVFDRYFSIDSDDAFSQLQIYAEKMMETTAGYLDIFQPKMIEGSAQSLLEPGKVLIPQSMAKRLFPKESAIDKRLRGEDFVWIVGGVYKDFPKNSSLHNFILSQLPEENKSGWALNYETYVHIDPSQDARKLLGEYVATIEPVFKDAGYENIKLFLSPIKSLHFDTTIGFDTVEKTSKTILWLLIGIAFVILVIAAINFTNYYIALTPFRIKSINTQKVLGSTTRALRSSLIIEAALVSLISFFIAVFLVDLVPLTPITNLLSSDLNLYDNIPLLIVIGMVALVTGIFTGIYPAYYVTSFAPALVLAGSFGLSPRGRKLRSTLIGVQFVTSFFLIVVALFMYLQTHHMQHTNPGYDRNQIIAITTNKQFAEQYELFASELKSFSGIESVGYSESLLASRDFYSSSQLNYKGKEIKFQAIGVDADFLETINIPLLEGRYFTHSDAKTEGENFMIFNERARKEYDLQIGDKLGDQFTVIGFIPDINYSSFRKGIEPLAFYLNPHRRLAYVRVEEGTNIRSAMRYVETTLERLSPGYPFEIRLLDEVANGLYAFENNLMLLITLFSLIAIILSMVGVFGLVIFEGEYKRKEIGIRKVFGSTTQQILERFNRRYVYLLVICFIIAAPLSWYAIHLWLQSFAYKTPIYWWVFMVAFLLVAILTFATVTFQSWRAANANPVDCIKKE